MDEKRIAHLCRRALPTEAGKIQRTLFWSLMVSIITFPLGQFFREACPLVSLAILFYYYSLFWNESNLRRMGIKWVFGLFYLLVLFKMLHSVDIMTSIKTVYPNIWKGFALPFIALESIRTTRQLKILITTFVATSIFQGIDGIWQSITGFDFIHKTPIMSGRLTGSLSTYRVGDYMALILTPACGVVALLPAVWTTRRRVVTTAVLLSPALYLLVLAQSRSGYAGFVTGIYLVWLLFITRPNLYKVLLPPLGVGLLLLFGPSRITLHTALQDQRFDLWRLAWEVFKAHPVFGAGAGAYNKAFRQLGLLPAVEPPSIQHPHNIYLQFLCETGLVGTVIAALFLAVPTFWTARIIRQGVRNEDGSIREHFRLTAFLWGGWICYLVNAMGAHDFYRTWWLAVAMTTLGCLLGASLHTEAATRKEA